MAAKKSYARNTVSEAPYPVKDYQCEEDARSLSRAAEVMADTVRGRKAMKMFRKQQSGGQKLIDALTGKQ